MNDLWCTFCEGIYRHEAWCNSQEATDEALASLRAKLTGPLDNGRKVTFGHSGHSEGYGRVTFQRTDGKTVTYDNVNVDGIGPDHNTRGVVSLTLEDETIIHLPFIESWTVEYDI